MIDLVCMLLPGLDSRLGRFLAPRVEQIRSHYELVSCCRVCADTLLDATLAALLDSSTARATSPVDEACRCMETADRGHADT